MSKHAVVGLVRSLAPETLQDEAFGSMPFALVPSQLKSYLTLKRLRTRSLWPLSSLRKRAWSRLMEESESGKGWVKVARRQTTIRDSRPESDKTV